MNIFTDERERKCSLIVFSIYLFFLVWLVLFKFSTDLTALGHIRSLNLTPFRQGFRSGIIRREMLYNVLVFIPAGFYLTAFFRRKGLFFGSFLVFLLSLSFEALQWIFAIGVSDITDLCNNTAGGLIGLILYLLMGFVFREKRMHVINRIGAGFEIFGFSLLGLLIVMN